VHCQLSIICASNNCDNEGGHGARKRSGDDHANGTEIGFRPTIQDSKPWTRVVVTIFKTPTASHPSQQLGEVEVKTGGSAVQSKTTPAFKVAVTRVSEPTS
jgi:hypothetical protein